jgi:hypothetical protein
LQQKRQIQVLRQEKKHLQSLLQAYEADVETLEEGKVNAETKNLLGDEMMVMLCSFAVAYL